MTQQVCETRGRKPEEDTSQCNMSQEMIESDMTDIWIKITIRLLKLARLPIKNLWHAEQVARSDSITSQAKD